jgi:hypothetical protein
MVRVDLDTLLRGFPIEGELCEVVGYGPVPVSVIQNLLGNDNTFLVGLLAKSKEIVGVRHFGRYPNSHQKSALDFLYPRCAVLGCSAHWGLQSNHRLEWRTTHFMVWDLLDRLCSFHHGLKTTKGWALVAGTGKRAFVPPDDLRHPGNGPAVDSERADGEVQVPRSTGSRSPPVEP